ncbi:MAG TPA: M14 family metallopeptidase [Thermoanaerobaculia bacterium]|nr:M14 family metallopeptidase [Thermoanaerobaculia bacterium]
MRSHIGCLLSLALAAGSLGASSPPAATPPTTATPPPPAALASAPGGAGEEPPVPQEWRTRAELSGFTATSSYEETLDFVRRLVTRSPAMRLSFFGKSAAGRPLPMVVVSREGRFEPGQDRRAGAGGVPESRAKPVVLILNAIHAGEIDGKDACLMLLRDLALGRHPEVLEAATLLVLPIYNADGHERVSPFNRPNQDGPRDGMGFRTNAAGLDLNRDFVKLASEEARSLVGLFNLWRPELVVDDHVTDGSDHDWVLTTAWAEAPQLPAPVDAWQRAHLGAVREATARAGHRNGPYVALLDPSDPGKGFSSVLETPRYSSGYFPLRNRPSVLIETHSYKPYRLRVLANRDFLLALLREIGRNPHALVAAVASAERQTVELGRAAAPPSEVVLAFEPQEPPDRISLPIYAWHLAPSLVSGEPLLRYERGKVREIEVPWVHLVRPTRSVPRPRGYLVLPGWPAIEQRLRGHGLRVERLLAPAELEVEAMRLNDPRFSPTPYQGLTRVSGSVARQSDRRRLPAGTLWVAADQPDFEVAVQLLEPEAPDSLVSWGLLSSVFEQAEYIEPSGLEKLAEQMINDPAVTAAWQEALADPHFAADRQARRRWWYRHTPYFDERVGLLPYFRLLQATRFATAPW